MAQDGMLGWEDLFDLSDPSGQQKIITALEAIDKSYAGMAKNVIENVKAIQAAQQDTVKAAASFKDSLSGRDLKGMQQASQQLDGMLKQNEALKKSQEEHQKVLAKLEAAIARLEEQKAKAKKTAEGEAGSLTKLKEELKKTEKEYRAMGEATKKAIGPESLKRINELSTAIQKGEQAIKDTKKSVSVASGSYHELAREVNDLNAQLKNMPDVWGKNRKEAEKLQKVIYNKTATLKSFDKSVNDSRRNVGNYSSAFENLTPILGTFGAQVHLATSTLGQIKDQLSGYRKGMQAAATGTDGAISKLKLFKIALVSTGIGAIVLALGALIGAFASTQRGMDALNTAIKPVSVTFQRLLGVLQDLSFKGFDKIKEVIKDPIAAFEKLKNFVDKNIISLDSLTTALSNPAKGFQMLGQAIYDNVVSRIEAVGVLADAVSLLMDGDFSGAAKKAADGFVQFSTGIENATDKVKNVTDAVVDFVGNAIDAAKEFVDESNAIAQKLLTMEKELELYEIRSIKRKGELREAIKKLNYIVEDETKTYQERKKAAEEALALQIEMEGMAVKTFDKKIALLKEEHKLNDTSRADLKELAELEAQRAEAVQAIVEARTTMRNKLNIIEKTEALARIKQQAEIRDAVTEFENEKADTIEASNRRIMESERELSMARKQASIDELKREINSRDTRYKDKIPMLEKMVDLEIALERERVQALLDAKDQELLDFDKAAARKLAKIKEQKEKEEAEALGDPNKQARIIEKYAAIELAAAQGLSDEKLALEKAVAAEKLSIQEDLQDRLTEKERAASEDRKKIAQDEMRTRVQMAQQITTAVTGLINNLYESQRAASDARIAKIEEESDRELESLALNEEGKERLRKMYDDKIKKEQLAQAKRDKKMRLFQATIAGVQAVVNALSSAPPPYNFILAALVGAAAGIQIAAINREPLPQFYKGTQNAPEGWAIVDERGPEVVESGGKKYLGYSDGPRITYLKAGDKVHPHHSPVTQQVLAAAMQTDKSAGEIEHYRGWNQRLEQARPRPITSENISQIVEIKIGQETDRIVNAVRSIPEIGIEIDELGQIRHWKRVQSKKTYLEKRYRRNG